MNGLSAIMLAISALMLLGCGARYDQVQECQRQLGPRPHQLASAFGLVGAVWSLDQPDTQAYNHAMDVCMQEGRR